MSIPSHWQIPISRPYGLTPYVKVVIDPDGDNLTISGSSDFISVGAINSSMDLDPLSMQNITMYELQVEFSDYNHVLDIFGQRAEWMGFRYTYGKIKTWNGTNALIKFEGIQTGQDGDYFGQTARFFRDVDVVTFVNGSTKDTNISLTKVETVVDANQIYQRIYFPYVANSYPENSIVALDTIIGKRVKVYLRFDGIDGEQLIYDGYVKNSFRKSNDKATLTLANLIGTLLYQKPVILTGTGGAYNHDPLDIVQSDGTFASSITWITGSGSMADPTVYDEAQIGKWTIEFTSSTEYKVTGPNCNEKTGDITADFFDQTDATDSQIKFTANTTFTGTINAGDKVEFQLSINYDGSTDDLHNFLDFLIQQIWVPGAQIVIDWGYFDDKFNKVGWNISFNKSVSVAEMVIVILAHTASFFTVLPTGKIRFFGLNDEWKVDLKRLGNTQKIYDVEAIDPYNEITINYGWDYDNNKYQFKYIYPLSNADNNSYQLTGKKRAVEINCPGFHDESDAEEVAKRFYNFWSMGPVKFKIIGYLDNIDTYTGFLIAGTSETQCPDPVVRYENGNMIGVIINTSLLVGNKNRVNYELLMFPYGELPNDANDL